MKPQLDRIKEVLKDLEQEYQANISSHLISDRARILTLDVTKNLSELLDQLAYRIWQKRIAPNLKGSEASKARIYFPCSKDEQSFTSTIGRWGIKSEDLIRDDSQLYNFLSEMQPYKNVSNSWLLYVKEIAAAKHTLGLTELKRTESNYTNLESAQGSVTYSREGVTFGQGVSILGAPIDPLTQRIIPTTGIKESNIRLVSFIIEGQELDALTFIYSSLQNVEELIKRAKKEFQFDY